MVLIIVNYYLFLAFVLADYTNAMMKIV